MDRQEKIKRMIDNIVVDTLKIFKTDELTMVNAIINYLNEVDGLGEWVITDITFPPNELWKELKEK